MGGCSTFVSAIRDSSLSSGDGNEHQALIISWRWHLWKKRLKINVTFHCPHMTRRRGKNVEKRVPWAERRDGVAWKKYRKSRIKDRSKEGEAGTDAGMILMTHISSRPQPHWKLQVLFISIHKHTAIYETGLKKEAVFYKVKPLGNFVPCRFAYFWGAELHCSVLSCSLLHGSTWKRNSSGWLKVFCHLSMNWARLKKVLFLLCLDFFQESSYGGKKIQ